MGERTCSHSGCPERHRALGYCDKHYQRFKKYGSTEDRRVPTKERFWSKVDASGVCWEWAASNDGKGYGQFYAGPGKVVRAHRWAYIDLCGSIPDDLTLDHLCRNTLCVNPDHLEPVTSAENKRRGGSKTHNKAKTHCPQDHPYSGYNLLVGADGWRECRICRNDRRRKYRARRRELGLPVT